MTRKKTSQHLSSGKADNVKLEIVLKCDVAGTVEAVRSSLNTIHAPGVEIEIIQSGVGSISKSDVLMAQTAADLLSGLTWNPCQNWNNISKRMALKSVFMTPSTP